MKLSQEKSKIILVVFFAGLLPSLISLMLPLLTGDTQYIQEPIHEFLEITCACIALGVSMLLLLEFHYQFQPHLLWVAAALAAMGLIDCVHTLVPFGIAWSWLRHGATLIGGLFFAMVWLPLPAFAVRRHRLCILVMAALAVVGSLALWRWPLWLPEPFLPIGYSLPVKLTNGLGGLGFLSAAVYFIRRFMHQPATEDLVFTGHTVLFGAASLMFGFSHLWAIDWWFWHTARLSAYAIVLIAAYNIVTTIYRQNAWDAHDLEDQVRERTATLQQSEEKFKSAFANAAIGFAMATPDGRLVDANPTYCRITGYNIEELRTMGLPQVIHPDDYVENMQLIMQMLRGQNDFFVLENRYVRKDKAVVWVRKSTSPVRDVEGAPQWVITLIEDITERRQAENALRQNQEDLDRAQQVGQIGSWRLDVQRNVLTWSAENHRIFGVPQGTPLTYETFLGIVHPDDRRYVDTRWKAGLAGEPYDIEHRILADGRIKWVREKAYLEFDMAGRLKGGFGITQDITERKWMEEALRRHTAELEELSGALEQRVLERTEELRLLNQELHESQVRLKRLSRDLLDAQEKERKKVAWELHDSIGSSLTAIKFRIENVLRESVSNGSQAMDTLEKVIPVVQTAVMEAKRIQMNLRPSILDDIGIVATTRWFCSQFRETYPEVQLERHVKIEEDDVPDSLKTVIFRIFQEGLNNAARHSNSPVVSFYLWKSNRTIKLLIRDRGRGFDLSEVRSRNGYRRGLGLESMRERTELSGGRFSIMTKQGKGTVLRASWPIVSLPG